MQVKRLGLDLFDRLLQVRQSGEVLAAGGRAKRSACMVARALSACVRRMPEERARRDPTALAHMLEELAGNGLVVLLGVVGAPAKERVVVASSGLVADADVLPSLVVLGRNAKSAFSLSFMLAHPAIELRGGAPRDRAVRCSHDRPPACPLAAGGPAAKYTATGVIFLECFHRHR